MFNVIKTLWIYFTRELLPYNLGSEVALHFSISEWQQYLVVSCSEEVFLPANADPVVSTCSGYDLFFLVNTHTYTQIDTQTASD